MTFSVTQLSLSGGVLIVKNSGVIARVSAIFLISFARLGASTILHTLDAQAYRDEAALYPMVGKVSGAGFNGSGVLISNRWVLTAGHVADFKTGGSFNIGGANYTIQSYMTAPGHAVFSTTYDVGLLYLSVPVSGIETATMLGFGTPGALLGREATWVGNGLPGTGLNDDRGSNEMRAFTNIIDGQTPRFGLPQPSFFADFDNPDGTSNSLNSAAMPTRLEGNVTPGDSGGGVFITVDGKSYLVGINSYTSGFAPGLNSKYGSLSGAADLEMFHAWIFKSTGISAVPEVGSLWFFSLGGLLIWMRRR
jgi:hypothetical protein